ncbi:MAG: four helix bundle protein [Deltaproteobacteria bacterium]|nr:four helix bundle protein [Deltaproteobacteria bacterium]
MTARSRRCAWCPLIERIRCGNRSIADQIVRAASSVLLNLGEGSQRRGADRMHFYRIAAGSAAEVRCALDAAEALGFIDGRDGAAAWDRFGAVVAMLRAITR